MPAAGAICLGRLVPPEKPPPAKPLRMLVTRKMPRVVEQRFRAGGEVGERVASEGDCDVVLLEDRGVGVAREPNCILEHPDRRAASLTLAGRRQVAAAWRGT